MFGFSCLDFYGIWDLIFFLIVLCVFFIISICCLVFLKVSVKLYVSNFFKYIFQIFNYSREVGLTQLNSAVYNFKGIGLVFQHFYFFWFSSCLIYFVFLLLFGIILEQSLLFNFFDLMDSGECIGGLVQRVSENFNKFYNDPWILADLVNIPCPLTFEDYISSEYFKCISYLYLDEEDILLLCYAHRCDTFIDQVLGISGSAYDFEPLVFYGYRRRFAVLFPVENVDIVSKVFFNVFVETSKLCAFVVDDEFSCCLHRYDAAIAMLRISGFKSAAFIDIGFLFMRKFEVFATFFKGSDLTFLNHVNLYSIRTFMDVLEGSVPRFMRHNYKKHLTECLMIFFTEFMSRVYFGGKFLFLNTISIRDVIFYYNVYANMYVMPFKVLSMFSKTLSVSLVYTPGGTDIALYFKTYTLMDLYGFEAFDEPSFLSFLYWNYDIADGVDPLMPQWIPYDKDPYGFICLYNYNGYSRGPMFVLLESVGFENKVGHAWDCCCLKDFVYSNINFFFFFFGCFCKLFLVLCFFFYLFFFSFFLEKHCYITFDVFLLMLLCFFGILLIFTVNDFIFLYISLELQSLCFYILASFRRHTFSLLDSGLKYYIIGSFASVLYLLGIACVYFETGLFNFTLLRVFCYACSESFILLFGLICICVSLLFKVMVVPFHIWSIDIYDGSHILVTTFFSVFPKIGIFFMIFYLFFEIFIEYIFVIRYLLVICSIFSIVYSTIACFVQYRIKRFLIFSSINHIGFCLVVLFNCDSAFMFSFWFYLFVYILTTLCLWCILVVLVLSSFSGFIYLIDFSGLFLYNPYLTVSLCVLIFSMMGLPPFIGFFSKLYIFYSLITIHYFFLILILLLFTVLSCYYYLRILKFFFFEKRKGMIFLKPITNGIAIIISLFVMFFVFYFIFASGVINLMLLFGLYFL